MPCTGYLQNIGLLTEEQIQRYMKKVRYVTTDDVSEGYEFILKLAKKGVRRFVLNVYSGYLIALSDLIKETRSLDSSLFVATLSNANVAREQVASNIYFSLTALSLVIKSLKPLPPTAAMTVVSENPNPFYQQVYEQGTELRYYLPQLTVEILNQFKGAVIFISLDTAIEYQRFVDIVKASSYSRQVSCIEIATNQIPIITELGGKVSSLVGISSGVSHCGNVANYPGVNPFTLYDNCSIVLVNSSKYWKNFINTGVLSQGVTNTGRDQFTIFPF